MSAPRLAPGLLLLVVAAGAFAQEAPRADQEVHRELVVDHGWGFMLAAPAPGWHAMGEVAARRVHTEAVAAILSEDVGVPITVSVKPRTVAAGERARSMVENYAFLDKQVLKLEEGTVADRPATLFEVSGRSGGNRVRITGAILEHRGHLFELLMVHQGEALPAGAFWGTWEAFQLLDGEGPLPGREPAGVTPPDTQGIGWRVRAGTFESAFLGVRIEPRRLRGLRLAVAAVARALMPGAEVILLDDASGIGLALVPMRASNAAGVKEWKEALLRTAGPAATAGPEVEYAFAGGETVALSALSTAGPNPVAFQHGVAMIDSTARFQVWGYAQAATPEQTRAVLGRACAAVELLEDGVRAELEAELTRGPDPYGRVGPDWCYRRDVYRHFGHDLSWTRPAGPWRVTLDDQTLAATAHGALIVAEAPRLGLRGWIACQRTPGYTLETLHPVVVRMVTRGKYMPLRNEVSTTRGGTPVHLSLVDVESPGVPRPRALVASACAGDRLIQAVVVGSVPDLEAAGDQVRALVDGLTVSDEDLVAEGAVEGGWRDERLGFELRAPGEGWTIGPNLRPGIVHPQSVRELQAIDEAGHRLLLMVVGDVEQGADPAFYEDYLRRSALGAIGTRLHVDVSEGVEQDTLGGVPARHLRGKLGTRGQLHLYLLHRASVHVVFSVVDEKGDGPPLGELKGCLRLLE